MERVASGDAVSQLQVGRVLQLPVVASDECPLGSLTAAVLATGPQSRRKFGYAELRLPI